MKACTPEGRLDLLLRDLHVNGAASYEDVLPYLERGDDELADLLALGEIATVPTQIGTAYVLGPHGKKRLGIRSSWVTRPDVALNQLLLRKVRAQLEAEGWRPIAGGALPYPCYLRPDGRPAYLLVYARGIRSRGVRRLLSRYHTQLLREGAMLLICTPQRKRLTLVIENSNGLVGLYLCNRSDLLSS